MAVWTLLTSRDQWDPWEVSVWAVACENFLSAQVPPPPNSPVCDSGRELFKEMPLRPGRVAHTWNPTTQVMETGGC